MIKSLRVRLLLWNGVVLALAVGSFATLVYWRADRDREQRAEEQVAAAARYLDVHLRTRPPSEVEGSQPPLRLEPWLPPPRPRPPGHPPGRPPPRHPPPGRPGFERPPPETSEGPPDRGFPDDRPPPPDDGYRQFSFVIWRDDGSILETSADDRALAYTDQSPPPAEGKLRLEHGGLELRAIMLGPQHSTILVIRNMRRDMAELHRFGGQVAAFGGVVLAVGLAGGWLVSSRLVRPIAKISSTAAGISATNLSGRIETKELDHELVELATVLNDTFARLEAAFERQTRFTADASHELRTPLAVIYSQLELALVQDRSPAEYKDTLDTCKRAAARLRSLIEGLLTLARADAGRLQLALQPTDLRTIVREAATGMEERAREAGISMECRLPQQPVVVAADAATLSRVPANLLANALQHTSASGWIQIEVTIEGTEAKLTVADSGSGIAPEHVPHLFERFYRADVARSRASGGCGLGLAICHSLVTAHGGRIGCTSQPGHGARFEVRLPLFNKVQGAEVKT